MDDIIRVVKIKKKGDTKMNGKEIKVKSINGFNKSFGIVKDSIYNAIFVSKKEEVEFAGYYGGVEKKEIIINGIMINGMIFDEQDFMYV